MKAFFYIALCFPLLALLASCSKDTGKDSDTPEEIPGVQKTEVLFSEPVQLVDYVQKPENGYYKEKEIEEIRFSALLKPAEYIKAWQLMKVGNIQISGTDDLQYFDLRIAVKDFNGEFLKHALISPQDYNSRISYCAFGMQNDIYLVDGRDTLPCIYFHFERTFDITPYGHFILAFDPPAGKNITTKTLIYHDRLFHKGIVKFTFTPDKLARSPRLVNS